MKVDGVQEAKADFRKDWAWAKYDPGKTSPEKLVKAINDNTSFKAKLPEKTKKEPRSESDPQAWLEKPGWSRSSI
jgi:hypothetical protein